MPKKLIKRYLPNHQKIREHKSLRFLGALIHNPHLWHLNRRSVAGAFAIGLFAAFIPLPSQMAIAAAAAIPFRVNLPIAVALVWITNPITMPPVYYTAYRLGAWVLGSPANEVQFEVSVQWLMTEMATVWKPFLLGSFIVGIACSIAGYFLVRLLWRLHVLRQLRTKRKRKRAAQAVPESPGN